MNRIAAARTLLVEVTEGWVSDPGSDVVWAGDHEGRRAVRMRQTVRDATTVWFAVGEYTVGIEALVLPVPLDTPAEVLRQCLVRNASVRRVHFALDSHGDLVLVGKVPLPELSADELEQALGEVYDLVERSLRPLQRSLPWSSPPREKTT